MKTQNSLKHFVTGAIVIIFGILLMANQFGQIPPKVADVVFHWPMILIALGIIALSGGGSKTPGIILISIGLFFSLGHHFEFPDTYRKAFWPALIIVAGVLILLRKPMHRRMGGLRDKIKREESNANNEFFEEVAIFGGGNKFYTLDNLRGGQITNVFGGSDIDLKDCTLAEEGAEIELFTVFGGSTIHVPASWNVLIKVSPILGGVEDKRAPLPTEKDNKKVLVIKGTVVFGGCEIKRS